MITRKTCPKCGSDDVVMISTGMAGTWKCRNCGFAGNMIEKPFVGRDKKIGEVRK
jgi:ribosomal protein L37AE/L43A